MSYTIKETAVLEAFEEVTYAQAVVLAVELAKPLKSIISKVQFLGIPYIKKAVPTPKPPQATKAEIVALIQNSVGEGFNVSGLSGATREALVELNGYLVS
jgi:hypothetical protein